ncbi:uncharacterized protein LOC114535015 [Dendronephthya gigantea]|uniref:uncharacterized protein LOC114535015 n=1 Tax=Dendronephthya gigantea TaxID=151771 RepID=UPI00106B9057|nr:uncharacterized protein LOC114535015 [Dendronephthya gigantea]
MVLNHGRLQVEKSRKCLDVDSGSKPSLTDNVRIYHCENSADQYFSQYENGEVVNDKSRMCLDVSDYSGSGNVNMYACEDLRDQMWHSPRQFCHGEYCSFLNRKSEECLDVADTSAAVNANVGTYRCTLEQDQRFRWVTGNWVIPTASWSLVGCNENGQVTQTISNTISYSSTISEETSVEVSATIEAGFKFGGASVTTTVSHSMAREWTESQEQTQEISFTCENYGNNQEFTGGCMWQLQMKTRKSVDQHWMVWKPQIVKCSRGSAPPQCPPFTRCLDEACTRCGEPGV